MNMKTYAEIVKERKALNAENVGRHARLAKLEEDRFAWKETQAERTKLSEEIMLADIQRKILDDNAMQAKAAEIRPALVELLEKYDGKPYGPKTADRLRAEFMERTGLWLFLDWNQYGNYCRITIQGRDKPFWDLDLVTENDSGRGLGGDHKLHSLAGDPLKLLYRRAYTEDPAATALEIVARYNRLKELAETLDAERRGLQGLLPFSMDCPYYANWNSTRLL